MFIYFIFLLPKNDSGSHQNRYGKNEPLHKKGLSIATLGSKFQLQFSVILQTDLLLSKGSTVHVVFFS